jgi:GNAT superfamily N-acetyltransferase
MPKLRYATPEDAGLITRHRHSMFGDNAFTTEDALAAADVEFEPWVRVRLADGRYVGLLLEADDNVVASAEVVAGAGIFFADFPPHWMDPQPCRAYVLNVYTAPGHRGHGHARRLMELVLAECRKRAVPTVVLHASPLGRPIYAGLGFTGTDEMMLRLDL